MVSTEKDPGREKMIEVVKRVMDNSPSYYESILAEKIVDTLIEADGGADHVVVSDGPKGTWTMRHPLTERFGGDLFECPFASHASQLAAQGAFDSGAHRLYVGDFGIVMWEEVKA